MADEQDKQPKADDKPKPRSRAKAGGEKAEPKAAAKSGARTRAKKDDEAKPRARKPAEKARGAKAETKSKATGEAKAKPAAESQPEPAAESKPAPRSEAKPKPRGRTRQAPRQRGAPEPSTRPVVRARAKYVRSSARKARLVMVHVRGKSVADARAVLRHSPRGVARDLERLLASAVANAENNHDLVSDDLFVQEIYADEGPTLRRFRPRALGRATRIRKRTSHLTVALSTKE